MNAQQLRNSILQEAIEGRLVPQDPNDEPASVLLDKIRKEKARLVKEGKIYKKGETKPLYTLDNFPFDIPEGWEWCQLSDASIIQEGAGIRKYQYTQDGIQLLCVTNILDGNIDLSKKTLYVSEKEYQEKYLHLTPQKGDIITACSGGSWGKISIFESDETVMLNTSTLRMRFFGDLAYNKYLYYIAQGKFFKDQLACQLVGIQPNFGYAHYSRICIPLPPLAEQKRIVAKIEELFPKVEEYGKAQEALDKLNKELPERLKKSILQEAISGRLVPQDPNDEPASVLLNRIREEKKRLVKEKKITLSKPEKACIIKEDGEFSLPQNWRWGMINDICRVFGRIGFRGYTKNDLRYSQEDAAISISPSNMINGTMDFSNCTYISEEKYEESPEIKIQNGDILIVKTGSSYGKTSLVENLPWKSTINPQIAVVKDIKINKEFLVYFFQSPYAQSKFKDFVLGTSIPTFSQLNLISMQIPLPPLAEQKRIVEKIEEVFKEIDKLKK